MIACVRGCRVPHTHVPPCTCTPECPPHDGHCPGCQPREATHGLLCHGDDRRVRDHLGQNESPEGPHGLAWAWDHLLAAHPYIATPRAAEGRTGRGVTDPEAERLAAVITLRTDIRDRLASWTADLAERTSLTGPPGITVSTDRPPAGPDRIVVHRCQTWLLRHVESLEAHESVADAWDELAWLMSRAHALAPWRPAPTRIDGVPCRCRSIALDDFGDEIKCSACGRSYTRDEYAILCKVMARRFAPEPLREPV